MAASVRRGIFDQTLFDKYGILTSRGIQKRYLEITYKRKKVEMEKAYLLLSDAEIKGNVTILDKNDDRTDKNDDRNEQRKVKESKGNNRRVAGPVPARTTDLTPFDLECTKKLIQAVKAQLPGAKVPETETEIEKWASHVEKMRRLDKRTEADIAEALQYAITDPFWKTNIRSTAKLREKFETLILQARQRPGRQGGGTKDADESKAWGSHRDYYSMYRA